MIAGLLECDHVDEKYRYIAGDYSDMFVSLFPNLEWLRYDVINGHFPSKLDECEVYFCTGSRYSVYDDESWIQELKHLIVNLYEAKVKFIGVCFGHQMLAEALGGIVQKVNDGWSIGNHIFNILHEESWMDPYSNNIRLQMMCQDQVIQLPPEATLLASTNTCPIAMYKVDESMLGIQGHPEFSNTYAEVLMLKRTKIIGETKVRAALKSLDIHTDQTTFRNWVQNFLNSSLI